MLEETHAMRFAVQRGIPLIVLCTRGAGLRTDRIAWRLSCLVLHRHSGRCICPSGQRARNAPQKVPKTPAAHAADCSAANGLRRRNRGDFLLHRPTEQSKIFTAIILYIFHTNLISIPFFVYMIRV